MAAPHHHHSCRPAAASCCCAGISYCCCSGRGGGAHQPPQPPPPADPLLQSLAAYLQLHLPTTRPQTQAQTTIYSHLLNPPKSHPQIHQVYPQIPKRVQTRTQTQAQTHSAVAALLRRIDALEASLRRHQDPLSRFGSLRDAAARIIQTRFRAFLVRRSRTLRQLKELAAVKSSLAALKAAVSGRARVDFEAISLEATDLLLKLDSLQGCDPMIRDGKMSISRDLVRFLEYIDGVSVKRAVKNGRFAAKNIRKSGVLVENIGGLGRGKHRTSRVYQVCGDSEEDDVASERFQFHPASDGDDDDDDDNEDDDATSNSSVSIDAKRNGVLEVRPGVQTKVKKAVSVADKPQYYNGDHISRVMMVPNGVVSRNSEGVCIDDQVEIVENHCSELEAAGGSSRNTKVKKTVSFADRPQYYNGDHLSRVLASSHEPISSVVVARNPEVVRIEDQVEMVENLCRELEAAGGLPRDTEDDEEGSMENESRLLNSDGEGRPKRHLSTGANIVRRGHSQAPDEEFVFSAPLPVQMESRTDLMNKRKAFKVVAA